MPWHKQLFRVGFSIAVASAPAAEHKVSWDVGTCHH
jgi:hypothetical protein